MGTKSDKEGSQKRNRFQSRFWIDFGSMFCHAGPIWLDFGPEFTHVVLCWIHFGVSGAILKLRSLLEPLRTEKVLKTERKSLLCQLRGLRNLVRLTREGVVGVPNK